ncbi:MAG: hypothetical protein HKN46_04885 [Acidimicrobiia bacterium]|nr:hypothetical protein [Acidimicrobiia bacterium]
MRRPIATVLTARPWEEALVRLAHASALGRVVARAWEPDGVDAASPDVVVVGAETAWLGRGVVAAWQGVGRAVVGVHASDSPGERRALDDLGVDHAVAGDDIERMLLTACRAAVPAAPLAPLVTVSGPRGAPGRSTVAIALARSLPGSTLVDGDPDPNLGPFLGLPPGPTPDELVDLLRTGGRLPRGTEAAGIRVLAPFGPLPPTAIPCLRASGPLVVDQGPSPVANPLRSASLRVFVVEGTAVGLVRAATVLREWMGPPPVIVLNKVPADRVAAIRACRAATGLEPGALVPTSDRPLEAAEAAVSGLAA